MYTLESALEFLLEQIECVKETEQVSLENALGRVSASDIASPMNVPPFDRSPLDGYALHSEDTANATREHPAMLKVIGEADAGCGIVFHPQRGEALRIMTGAPVPAECDCVIRQEDTDEGMDIAAIYVSARHNSNICRAGEDIAAGTTILKAGERLTCAHIGVLSSFGITEVTVYRRVKAALLCTGDEVVSPGQPLTYGKIYDSNGATISARLAELGIICARLHPEADDAEHVAHVIDRELENNDIVITTGGVSVGKKDIFHEVIPMMGAEQLFWKVAMKPGSPMLAARKNGKIILCLSGNPFAAVATFEIFAAPMLKKMSGNTSFRSRRIKAILKNSFGKAGGIRRIIRAYFDGTGVTLPESSQGNGTLSGMIGCNCLIDIPKDSDAPQAGETVEVILL